jgi:putative ABC transport system permease protein
LGLGLLIGVTLSMAGIYRGMVDDAQALLANSGADLWVVQKDTQGPYAEASSIKDDVVRSVRGMPGVGQAANVTYLTHAGAKSAGGDEVRVMVVGIEPGQPGEPGYLVAGRQLTRNHYEAVADVKTGFANWVKPCACAATTTQVVGLTQRMVSSGGDPMVFIALKDAQEAQFLKDNDAILNDRLRTAANPAFNRPGVPGLLDAVQGLQTSSHNVNAVLVQLQPEVDRRMPWPSPRRWKHVQVFTRADMEEILVAKLIANSAKQIGMFLVILSVVSAAIVAFIIYTMTLGKDPRDCGAQTHWHAQPHHCQHDLAAGAGFGADRFFGGQSGSTAWAPVFPKFVLLLPKTR